MGALKHRIARGRTCDVCGPDAIEMAFVGMTVSVVSVIGVWFGAHTVYMAKTLDAVSAASGPQTEAVIYYAEHGRWPSPGDQDIVTSEHTGTYFKNLAVGGAGVITAELEFGPAPALLVKRGAGLQHGRLSFQPELLGSRDSPSIAYRCGYAAPTPGAVGVAAGDGTTLPRRYLPPFCR